MTKEYVTEIYRIAHTIAGSNDYDNTDNGVLRMAHLSKAIFFDWYTARDEIEQLQRQVEYLKIYAKKKGVEKELAEYNKKMPKVDFNNPTEEDLKKVQEWYKRKKELSNLLEPSMKWAYKEYA